MKGWFRENYRHSLAAKGYLTKRKSFVPIRDAYVEQPMTEPIPEPMAEMPVIEEKPKKRAKPKESIFGGQGREIKQKTKGPYKKTNVAWWEGQAQTLFDKTATVGIKNWKWIRFLK